MHLVFGMFGCINWVDAHFKNLGVALFQQFVDFFVGVAWHKTQLVLIEINGHRIGGQICCRFRAAGQFASR